jgi:hypothetical protein
LAFYFHGITNIKDKELRGDEEHEKGLYVKREKYVDR